MKRRGFSLIELLAVIFLISLIFGVSLYYIDNVRKKATITANAVTIDSIKKSANLYVKEFADDIKWQKVKDNKTVCIYVEDLIKNGYIKADSDVGKYISIQLTKNSNEVIIKEEIDTEECIVNSNIDLIDVPTCVSTSITYNADFQRLSNFNNLVRYFKDPNVIGWSSGGGSRNTTSKYFEGRSAKIYKFTYSLPSSTTVSSSYRDEVNNLRWRDGTKGEKDIYCVISKRTPDIIMNFSGQNSRVGSNSTVSVYTNAPYYNKSGYWLSYRIPGTFSVKSGNSNYVDGLFDGSYSKKFTGGPNSSNASAKLTVKKLAETTAPVNLYVTFTPNDVSNYYSNTRIYTVGSTTLTGVTPPKCPSGLRSSTKEFIVDKNKGYTLNGDYKFRGTYEEHVYQFSVSLNYGYYWKDSENPDLYQGDDKFKDISLTCDYPNIIPSTLEVRNVYEADSNGNKVSNLNYDIFHGNLSSGTLMKSHYVTIQLESNTVGTIDKISFPTDNLELISSKTEDGITHFVTLYAKDVADVAHVTFDFSPEDYRYSSFTFNNGYTLKIVPDEFNLTYNYNVNSFKFVYINNTDKQFFRTGAYIFWNKDFDISLDFVPNIDIGYNLTDENVPKTNPGKDYMVLGTYYQDNNQKNKQLLIRVNTEGKIVAEIGNNTYTTTSAISFGESIHLDFSWDFENKKFDLTAKGNYTNLSLTSSNVSISDGASAGIHLGTTREQPLSDAFTTITVSNFNINYKLKYMDNIVDAGYVSKTNKLFYGFNISDWVGSNGYGTLTDASTMPAYDLTLTSQLNGIDQHLILDSGSGVSNVGTANVYYRFAFYNGGNIYYSDSKMKTLLTDRKIKIPTKKGYNFAGYYTGQNGSGTKYIENDGKIVYTVYRRFAARNNDGTNCTTNCSIKLYARWIEKSSYTVTYDANGGIGAPEEQIKYHGENLTLSSTTPTRTGCTFKGWNTKADGTGTSYAAGALYTTNANLKLYAQWNPVKVTVKFHKNTSSTDTNTLSQTFTYDINKGYNDTVDYFGKQKNNKDEWVNRWCTVGKDCAQFGKWDNTGYTLLGWSETITASTQHYNVYAGVNNSWIAGSTRANKTIDLYAIWQIKKFTVTYDGNGNTGGSTSAQEFNYNVGCKIRSNGFTKIGYIFTGWNTRADGKGTAYTAGKQYSTNANLKLYAQWKPITYKIHFSRGIGSGDLALGADMEDISCTYDVSCTLTASTFQHEKYHFYKWNINRDGRGTYYSDKASVKNLTTINNGVVTLYAQWRYYIFYYGNGNTSQTYDDNTKCWSNGKCGLERYQGNSTVEQYADGSNHYDVFKHRQGYVFGEVVRLAANGFHKSGYTFDSWNTAKNGSGTSYQNTQEGIKNFGADKGFRKLYAQWISNSSNTFTVKYVNDSTEIEQTCVVGSTCKVLDNMFTKYGKKFTRWKDSGNNYYSPGNNISGTKGSIITLYAQWTAVQITIKYDAAGGTLTNSNKKPPETKYSFGGTVSLIHADDYFISPSGRSYKAIPGVNWILASAQNIYNNIELVYGDGNPLVLNEEFLRNTSCDTDVNLGLDCTITLCARWNLDLIVTLIPKNDLDSPAFNYEIYSGRAHPNSNLYDTNYNIKSIYVGVGGNVFNVNNNGYYYQANSSYHNCGFYDNVSLGTNGTFWFKCAAYVQNQNVTVSILFKNSCHIDLSFNPTQQTRTTVWATNLSC